MDVDWLARGEGDDEEQLERFATQIKAQSNAQVGGARAALRQARDKAGLSYKDLGKRIGRDPAYLRSLEEGSAPISENTAELICSALPALSVAELVEGSEHARIMGGTTGTYGAKVDLKLPPGMKGRYVPLLSNAQAGHWDADHSDSLYDYTAVFAPNVDDRRAFAIKVSGNSMEPQLMSEDMVICSPESALRNGDAAVVRTKSDQVFIKYWQKRGDRVVLESANPDYKPIEFPLAEIAGAWAIVQRINSGKITKQLPI